MTITDRRHMLKLAVAVACSVIGSCATTRETQSEAWAIVDLPEYYCGEGVIVPTSCESYPMGEPGSWRITPSLRQITEAEEIFKKDLLGMNWKLFRDGIFGPCNGDSDSVNCLRVESERQWDKYRANYNRYYLGYVKPQGDTVVRIELFDYVTIESRIHYDDWRNRYIWGAGDFYDKYSTVFDINLKRQEIEYRAPSTTKR